MDRIHRFETRNPDRWGAIPSSSISGSVVSALSLGKRDTGIVKTDGRRPMQQPVQF
jgi:hypothetical protein